MKKILITTILILCFFQANSQNLTHDDFVSLIPALKQENWKSVFKESTKLLKENENDTTEYHAIILYINIFSAAGMVSEGQMSYAELEKNIMKFEGQKVILPAHPVTTRVGALGQIKFEVNDSTNKAFISATNAKGFNILCFENISFKDKINLSDFPQKSLVRCGGTLEKIETNPNKSKIWILRLRIKDAFARRADR